LAVQLPEKVEEARAVLDEVAYLLESYLIAAPRELWRREWPRRTEARPSVRCALAMTLGGVLALSMPAAIVAMLTGLEAASGWVMMVGVMEATLVLGRAFGVLFALGSAIAHNFLVIPPAFEFNPPTFAEFFRLLAYVSLALSLPSLIGGAIRARGLVSGAPAESDAASVGARSRD